MIADLICIAVLSAVIVSGWLLIAGARQPRSRRVSSVQVQRDAAQARRNIMRIAEAAQQDMIHTAMQSRPGAPSPRSGP